MTKLQDIENPPKDFIFQKSKYSAGASSNITIPYRPPDEIEVFRSSESLGQDYRFLDVGEKTIAGDELKNSHTLTWISTSPGIEVRFPKWYRRKIY